MAGKADKFQWSFVDFLKKSQLMGLPNLTPEEEYLLKKFALLKKKVDLSLLQL